MKLQSIMLVIAIFVSASKPAFAQKMNADDLKWINQCIDDNKGDAPDAVIRRYCMCMNEEMDSKETRSVTEWEKSNPTAQAACDKESGWK